MMRRYAPHTDDEGHADEHATMMIFVRGIDAGHTLHEHDARENPRPGRRRQRDTRDMVAEHLTGPYHGIVIEPTVIGMEALLDLHNAAHREAP